MTFAAGPLGWLYQRPFAAAILGRFVLGGLMASCLLLGGCARWSQEQASGRDTNLLPPRPLSPDSVKLETVLVRFPQSHSDEVDALWQLCNESAIELALRQRLDRNGLRAGVLVGQLPPAIREQLEETAHKQTTDALEHAGLAADVDNKMRLLQCRAGRRKDLPVKPELPDPLTVLTTRDGKHVSGATYERASLLFNLRAMPHGDGSATVDLIPEIHHGDHRQTFVRTELGTRPEIRRSIQSWEELKVSVKLHPQQVLLLSSTSPPKALGSAFFVSKTADHLEERVVLLVRLAETRLDELFAPEVVAQAHAMAER